MGSPIISQVYKHASLNYPFNEKELVFQAYTMQEMDTCYISLKSDPKIL